MALTLRKVRLRSVWLLIVPFLWLSRPTPELLLIGGALAACGLFVRARAAGFIHKDRELTTTGPYAHTRNPLYLGSFLLGLGVTTAGGRMLFVAVFVLFFGLVYSRTIRGEAQLLEQLFGAQYRQYATNVPLFLPRLRAWHASGPSSSASSSSAPSSSGSGAPAFSLERWRRNREYEALLGAIAGFAFLALRMWML